MKIFNLSPLISLIGLLRSEYLSQFRNVNETYAIATAIWSICDEYFVKKSIKFDFIIYGFSSGHLKDVIDEILRKKKDNAIINIQHVENIREWKHTLEDSAIIFMKNAEVLKNFNSFVHFVNPVPKDLKLLFYFENEIKNIALKIPKLSTVVKTIPNFEYFIVNSAKLIQLFTIENFSMGKCNKIVPKTLNIFHKKIMKWKWKLKNYRKFTNFHGCPLTVLENYGSALSVENLNSRILNCLKSQKESKCHQLKRNLIKDSNLKFRGLTFEFFKILSKMGNFSVKFEFLPITALNDSETYVRIWRLPYIADSSRKIHFLAPLVPNEYLMLTTPSEFYTNYEKLLLPFDSMTWTLLLFTIGCTYAVKLILNQLREEKVKKYTSQSAMLSIVQTIFGNSLSRLPQKSITRIFFMLFVFFCLIFRTCYQNKLFEFITNDMRKAPPRDINEIFRRGYNIVSYLEPRQYHFLKTRIMAGTG